MSNKGKGKTPIVQSALFWSILHVVIWFIIFLGIDLVLCILLVYRGKEFSTAAFIIGLITFFVGMFSMSRGTSQDFNPWSYLGSRCVQSMQDPGNDNYAKHHTEESIIIPNQKSIAFTMAGIVIFLISFL